MVRAAARAHGSSSRKAMEANETLVRLIEDQTDVIHELEAEIKLLRAQIAARKPKGGRERLPDEVVQRIEEALEAGRSTRAIGKQFRVSAMSVSRVRKRVLARDAQSA